MNVTTASTTKMMTSHFDTHTDSGDAAGAEDRRD